ncbi:hypothetical protein F5876DRAFT_22197, partial [Lentinula aff. lateritia]
KLEGMRGFLKLYSDPLSATYGKWQASSIQAAVALGQGTYCARQLRNLARAYILDRKVLPNNPYGRWSTCMLADEDLVNEISLYLQELGNKITAEKLVHYLARPDVMERHSIDKRISVCTARRYLNTLNYRFEQPKKGQYKDGHERPDVVKDCDKQFIPKMHHLLLRAQMYDQDGLPLPPPLFEGKPVVIWYHDESIFYAHDRRRKAWYPKDCTAKLQSKGDGAPFMIADYVSSQFGWLASPDGLVRAR